MVPSPCGKTAGDKENPETSMEGREDSGFLTVRLAAHVSQGCKSQIRPVVGRI